jgi:AAA domain/Bifunctional DNA primase/polymerase, N-terminal
MEEASANLCIALEHARAGIPVFPAFVTRCFNTWRKKPCIAGWRDEATTDEVQIRVWWREFPRAVPGIELGRAGLVVIDPDRHGKGPDGIEAFTQLCADIGGIPRHPTTNTPQGYHHIFKQNGGAPLGNSTGSLPPGIDVRGTGGWIVAPGSVRLDGVTYSPREGAPPLPEAYRSGTIPPLPEKIDALIREPSYRPRSADSAVVAASGAPVNVEVELGAMEYESATGNGINATVCRVIPSLLRKGEHPDDVLERIVASVMGMAERCGLKWSQDAEVKETRKRVLSAYNNLLLRDYDPTTGGVPAWLPGEFHARWIELVAAGQRPRFGFNRGGFYVHKTQGSDADPQVKPGGASQPGDQAGATEGGPSGWMLYDSAKIEPPRWLVKGILPESGVAIIPGQWGSYKTTTALDLALSVMTGRAFAGRYRIKRKGAVIYFALEGAGTLQSRLAAIAKQYEAPDKLPFAWRSDCPLLTAKDAGTAIAGHCDVAAAYFKRVYGVPTVLILIDTYAVAAGFILSGDDSDTAATQKAFTALRYVHKHTGAAVVVVDHFGKVMEAGTRGSSNKEGNADAVLATLADKELSGTIANTRLAVRKQRDGLSGFEIPFSPQVIELGLDEDGDPVTAVVLDWGTPRKAAGETRKPKDVTLLCNVLAEVVAGKGFPFLPSPGGPSVQACHGDDLRDAFCERRHASSRQARWAAFSRALKAAATAALVATREQGGERFIVWAR